MLLHASLSLQELQFVVLVRDPGMTIKQLGMLVEHQFAKLYPYSTFLFDLCDIARSLARRYAYSSYVDWQA